MNGPDVEIVRADPVLHRRVLLVLVAVVLIGAAALHAIFTVARESPAEAERQARILMVALLGPIVLLTLVAAADVVRTG